MKTSKSIVLKYNMKNLISKLLPIVKKVNKKINKIKSRVMKKVRSNKKVSKATKAAKATKNIINTPKIAIEKSPIVDKPNVVTLSKIATKPKIVVKPNVVTPSKIAIEKNNYKITIPAFKVCVSEMQSKNTPRDEDITKNNVIWHHNWLKYNKENGCLERRHILWVFWDNKHITELCKKWLCCDGNYAYTRFEELCTYSSEVFFTSEHKATLSEQNSHTYIDIDDLKIFRDLHSEETILRTKK